VLWCWFDLNYYITIKLVLQVFQFVIQLKIYCKGREKAEIFGKYPLIHLFYLDKGPGFIVCYKVMS